MPDGRGAVATSAGRGAELGAGPGGSRRELAFVVGSGTGPSLLSITGGLQALRDHGIEPAAYLGTSGSTIAFAFDACGLAPDAVLELALRENIAQLVDLGWRKWMRLVRQGGFDDGRRVRDFVGRNTRWRTFADLYAETGRELFITATDVLTPTDELDGDRPRVVLFSRHSAPDMRIVDAVLPSIAIPGVFAPQSAFGIAWSDGGISPWTNYDMEDADRVLRRAVELGVMAPMPVLGMKEVPLRPEPERADPFERIHGDPRARAENVWLWELAPQMIHAMHDFRHMEHVAESVERRTAFLRVKTDSFTPTGQDLHDYFEAGLAGMHDALAGGLLERARAHMGEAFRAGAE